MVILVTGGKGYIGAAVIKKLVERGHRVICLDLKTSPGRLGDLAGKVVMIGGGIPGAGDLSKIMTENKVDRVAHMVFFMSGNMKAEEIQGEISSMIMATANVFEAARRCGINRIVFPSSIHYYGPQWLHGEVYLNEESPSLAETIYGIGKKLNEAVAYTYNMRAGMLITSLRIPAVYGPGARMGARGVNVAAVECALGKGAILPYPPCEKVCIAHIDDVSEIAAKILLADSVNHYVYNVGGHTLSYWQIAAVVREILPEADVWFNEAGGRTDLPYLIDWTRIQNEFGLVHRAARTGYLDLINSVRKEAGLVPL